MKIPELLLTVVKKLHPEIEDLIINNFKRVQTSIDPRNFEPNAGYILFLDILINKGKNPKHTPEEYAEKIKTIFLYTFTEIDYIGFVVEKFQFHKELTREEMFMMLFDIESSDLLLNPN